VHDLTGDGADSGLLETPGGLAAPGHQGLVIASSILAHQDELLEALVEVATHGSAVDEIHRSVRVLAGSGWELARSKPPQTRQLAVFLPSNNVLYSYTLFIAIPALFTAEVTARPSARVDATFRRIHEMLGDDVERATKARIDIVEQSQRRFLQTCTKASAVVFTGQFSNSLGIADQLPDDCLFLTLGSGPNPLVVGETADVERVIDDLINARLYNSGQDCLCPDITFVHSSIETEFVDGLADLVSSIEVGDRRSPDTRVAPLVYPDAAAQASGFLRVHADDVVTGGRVDREASIIEPTVLRLPFDPQFHPPELFSPIFPVVAYDDVKDVREWLHSPIERDRGMYLSVYGEETLMGSVIGTSVNCFDQITLDAEDGNRPFGGFGVQASNVRVAGTVAARPLLISKEMACAAPRSAPRRRGLDPQRSADDHANELGSAEDEHA
jgi:acyl-CoA reductase-like NAD-dependent aldehyde dehydrogenase